MDMQIEQGKISVTNPSSFTKIYYLTHRRVNSQTCFEGDWAISGYFFFLLTVWSI